MNLSVNQPTQVNFQANIVKTQYLKEGFTAARNYIEQGKLQKAQDFYESLSKIKNSKNIHNFSISISEGSILKSGTAKSAVIEADTYKIKPEAAIGLIFDGNQCVEHINNFAKKFLNKKPAQELLSKEVLSDKLNSLWEKIS